MGDDQIRTRRAEYSEATRQALIDAGRSAFAEIGYQAAKIEAISRSARVTRGAFYHHFEDKAALFDAAVVELQAAAAARVETDARAQDLLWDRLTTGIDTYLDASIEPDYARIVIRDAPAVLGPERFREIEERYPMALLTATLTALHRRGEIDFPDIDLLSRMLDAMICKVAVLLPGAKDAPVLRKQAESLILTLLEALRRR